MKMAILIGTIRHKIGWHDYLMSTIPSPVRGIFFFDKSKAGGLADGDFIIKLFCGSGKSQSFSRSRIETYWKP